MLYVFRYFSEIRKATGLLTSADTVSEVLLFSTDYGVLEKVAQHDEKAGMWPSIIRSLIQILTTTHKFIDFRRLVTLVKKPSESTKKIHFFKFTV